MNTRLEYFMENIRSQAGFQDCHLTLIVPSDGSGMGIFILQKVSK